MTTNLNQLKRTLKSFKIEWHPLFNECEKVEPFYFGIYKLVYKPGFHNAEKLYLERLQSLIEFVENLVPLDTKAEAYVEQIKSFHAQFNYDVDFHSMEFHNTALTLIKPLSRLTRQTRIKVGNRYIDREAMVNSDDSKVLKKYGYQLNPYNYSYHYLTHFFYVTNDNVKTILVDDTRRKPLRRLMHIFELNSYISELEIPRRTYRHALAFRYMIHENMPGLNHHQSIVFSGVNYDLRAGEGSIQTWGIANNNKWSQVARYPHWRR